MKVCAAETGHVYIVSRAVKEAGEGGQGGGGGEGGEAAPALAESDEACQTFQLVLQPDPSVQLMHSISACHSGNLYYLGGNTVVEGPRFGYIWCSFDLQEFHTRYTER